MTNQTDNAEVLVARLHAICQKYGYTVGTRANAAEAMADLLANIRLYCHTRGIGWDRLCAMAQEQVGYDLGELQYMTTECIDLRRDARSWEKVT